MTRLASGVRFQLHGIAWEIDTIDTDGRVDASNLGVKGERGHFTASELVASWAREELVFEAAFGGVQPHTDRSIRVDSVVEDFKSIADRADGLEAWRRYLAIRPLLRVPAPQRTEELYRLRAASFMIEDMEQIERGRARHTSERDAIAADKPASRNTVRPGCSWRSIQLWLLAFERAERDIRALVPNWRLRGGSGHPRHLRALEASDRHAARSARSPEASAALARLIDQAINDHYLSMQAPPLAKSARYLDLLIAGHNRDVCGPSVIPLISSPALYHALRRRLKEREATEAYEMCVRRRGKRVADQWYGMRGKGPISQRALYRVEFDWTRLPLVLVDEVHRLPLGRPTLGWLIDHYTKMVVGFYVGFEPPSYAAVELALFHAIRPKTDIAERFPRVNGVWPAAGRMEWLIVDNGPELVGKDLDHACAELGVNLDRMPVRHPWFKALVEARFGGLQNTLLSDLPGKTFSDIFERGDYDPRAQAVLTLGEFLELLHIFLVDEYHATPQKQLGGLSPNQKWHESLLAYPPDLPPRALDLEILLGSVEERTLQNDGIVLEHLWYNAPTLTGIRAFLGPEGRRQRKVVIKRNLNDLSRIFVQDPRTGRYLVVPALDTPYTRGLTAYSHRVLLRWARREMREAEHDQTLRTQLRAARESMQTLIVEAIARTKARRATDQRTSETTRLARLSGLLTSARSDRLPTSRREPSEQLPPPVAMSDGLPMTPTIVMLHEAHSPAVEPDMTGFSIAIRSADRRRAT